MEYRISDAVWGRGDLAIVEESWWKTRRKRTWVVSPAGRLAPRVLLDRSSEDRYADPGDFVTAPNPRGRPVLLTSKDGKSAYLGAAIVPLRPEPVVVGAGISYADPPAGPITFHVDDVAVWVK